DDPRRGTVAWRAPPARDRHRACAGFKSVPARRAGGRHGAGRLAHADPLPRRAQAGSADPAGRARYGCGRRAGRPGVGAGLRQRDRLRQGRGRPKRSGSPPRLSGRPGMSLLALSGLQTFYGASQALFGVDLDVAEGEVVALMGRNGMGKTTTIRSIMALTPARTGAIRIDGSDVTAMSPHRIARRGLGLVPEGRRCFPNLTVAENLVAAARQGRWALSAINALFPRLAERRDQMARTLSGGEQQMLAI